MPVICPRSRCQTRPNQRHSRSAVYSFIETTPFIAQDASTYMTIAMLACGMSIFGYLVWLLHPLLLEGILGFPPISLTIGCVIGALLGVGLSNSFAALIAVIDAS